MRRQRRRRRRFCSASGDGGGGGKEKAPYSRMFSDNRVSDFQCASSSFLIFSLSFFLPLKRHKVRILFFFFFVVVVDIVVFFFFFFFSSTITTTVVFKISKQEAGGENWRRWSSRWSTCVYVSCTLTKAFGNLLFRNYEKKRLFKETRADSHTHTHKERIFIK